jgi:hypothetical protein
MLPSVRWKDEAGSPNEMLEDWRMREIWLDGDDKWTNESGSSTNDTADGGCSEHWPGGWMSDNKEVVMRKRVSLTIESNSATWMGVECWARIIYGSGWEHES